MSARAVNVELRVFRVWRVIGLLLFLCFAGRVFAAYDSPLVLGGANRYALGGAAVEVLEDPGHNLAIGDVVSARYANKFISIHNEVPNFGMTNSAFWFRFTVAPGNRGSTTWLLLLDQPLMNLVDLYVPRQDGGFDVKRSGDQIRMSQRDIQEREIVLPLPLDAAPRTFYLRTWIAGRAQIPLTIMTQGEYQRRQARKNFFAGAYVSFLLVIILLGISIYLVLREACILLYAAYAAAILLTYLCVNGYFYQYVLPEHPRFHEYLMMQFASLAVLAGFQFARSFLRIAKYSPVFYRVFGWILTLNLLMVLFCHLIPTLVYKRFLTFSLSGLVIVTLAAALISYRRGFVPARFYIYGRVLMCILGLAYTLSSENILPVTWLTMNSLLLRSLGDLVFITMAILHYFYVTHQQLDRLVSDLEREVVERTMSNRALTSEIEERLRLERLVVRIGDKERSSISRQLHDGLCQQLAGIRIHFATLEDQLASSSKPSAALTAKLPYIGKLLDDAVDHTYNLSRGLWSCDSDGKGAIPDLHSLVKELAAFGSVPIKIEQHHDCISCGGESLIQAHYIAREAITNALKHANATCIVVVLRCDPEGGVFLKITDDGKGKTSKQTSSIGGGMGIGIMKHRAIMMGGKIAISQEEGGGAAVTCTAPCCGRFTKETEHE